jgi:hypothetical protein
VEQVDGHRLSLQVAEGMPSSCTGMKLCVIDDGFMWHGIVPGCSRATTSLYSTLGLVVCGPNNALDKLMAQAYHRESRWSLPDSGLLKDGLGRSRLHA